MNEQFDILGVKISATNLADSCDFIENKIRAHDSSYICIAPVATIVDCQKDHEYLEVINNASMTTPDGMPVVWLGKFKGYKQVSRTYGPDLLDRFCRLGCSRGYSHYFYGGTQKTNQLLEKKLKEKYPEINIVGRYAPPFRKIKEEESFEILEQINTLKPDVLWVGLGSPKQDFWMAQHQKLLDVGVMIGVGAAFDFIAGTKKQAPVWMQKTGLEWLFRLFSEPKRLWKRYLIGNSLFILYLIRNFFNPSKIK